MQRARRHSVLSDSATPWTVSPAGSSVHGILQPRIRELGCHFLLQGIFLNQGSNLCPLHCQADSLPLSHLGSPSHPEHSHLKKLSFLEFHFQISILKSFYISLLPAAGLYTLVHGLNHLKNFKKLQVIGLTKFLGQSAMGPGLCISIKLPGDPNTLPGGRMVDLRDKTQAPSQVYQISPQYSTT